MFKVACLRPRTDFSDVFFEIPSQLETTFCTDYEEEAICAACKNADAIIAPSPYPKITGRIIRSCPNLKLIQLTGAGFNTVDLNAAKEKGIWVANVPGGNAKAVAEYTFIIMGMLLRHFMISILGLVEGDYYQTRELIIRRKSWEFKGRILGIIGMGQIGVELAKIAHFFGMQIIYYDIISLPISLQTELNAIKVELDVLLESSDIVSIHVPLNQKTEGLIGLKELQKMKNTAFLINASRGGIVDETALCIAIEKEFIAGAAVDSFTSEPLPADHPLVLASKKANGRLILTPHIAGITVSSFQKMFSESWANVIRVMNGGKPLNIVY